MAQRQSFIRLVCGCCGVLLVLLLAARPAAAQTGACCDVNQNCTVTDACTCTGGGGFYQGNGTMCSTSNPCTAVAGACCTNLGCTLCVAQDCAQLSGTFFANGNCFAGVCTPEPSGACCCPSGVC